MTTAATRKPAARSIPCWGWWAMMVLPAFFVLAGSLMLLDGLSFATRAERALATVVSVERIAGSSSSGPSNRPTVSYADALGQSRMAVTHISAGHYDYATGEKVEILYDPAEPGEIRIAEAFSLWGLPLLFILLGGAFLAMVNVARRKLAPPATSASSATVRR